MKIGQVVQGHYQVVAKLGYGTGSTVWLSRDLWEPKYWALKVHVNTLKHNQELEVYEHLASVDLADHPGQEYVRKLETSFKLRGPHGEHAVFVMKPLGMSLRSFQDMQREGVFQKDLAASAVDQVLLGLSYLHDAGVVHTDLHSDNLLIALTNDSVLAKVEENEMQNPCPRKQIGDSFIYVSRHVLSGAGPLTISDFGQARIGMEQHGNAMPVPYRAPEVILNMPWGSAVDVWSVALLAWDLLERRGLFRIYNAESQELNDAHHLAAMTALLGPPPPDFLKRSDETRKYWTEDGEWRGPVPLPPATDLNTLARDTAEEHRDMFLSFVECNLCWLPEERLTALQSYFHPWLRGKSPEDLL
ncbi:hypothetical protein VTK73DRAFT_8263 [Phialemonium thermophilum]|uniref:Protein kinase domain-containing protein n=1 Tax=Phialemonium thermophilum TaxID=223376 RepID=A0ABR3XQP1_9PEZI